MINGAVKMPNCPHCKKELTESPEKLSFYEVWAMKCPNCRTEINPASELAKLGKGIPKPRPGYDGGWPARRRNKVLTELNADGKTFDEVTKWFVSIFPF